MPEPTVSGGTGVRVAVDAMGGDHGPSEVVPGALDHARNHGEDRLILVGDEATIRRAVPALKTRLAKLADAADLLEYLWTDPPPPELDPDSVERIRIAAAALKDVPWEPEAIHVALMAVVEKSGLGANKTFMPIRLAVTGKKISPPIDYTLALLPNNVAMSRLQRAIASTHSGPA